MALEEADFSDEFCQFLQTSIPRVEAAELLLALRREPQRWWTEKEAVAALGTPGALRADEAARLLADLQAQGLVALDAEGRAQYRIESEAPAAHVATLEKVYRERPVTLIRVIYGLRDHKIRSFAEAFKLRGK
jgi:hypothetical protein